MKMAKLTASRIITSDESIGHDFAAQQSLKLMISVLTRTPFFAIHVVLHLMAFAPLPLLPLPAQAERGAHSKSISQTSFVVCWRWRPQIPRLNTLERRDCSRA